MFALRITYLTGVARAADVATGNDKSAPEWPPHPSRLFSALVSAWAAAGLPEAGRRALEWLERQGPPSLFVGECGRRELVTAFVPANDEETLPARRRRNARTFPAAIPEDDAVFMIWPAAEVPEDIRTAMATIVARLPSLGHPASLVDVRLCDEAPSPNLVPVDSGKTQLRVLSAGRLARLEELFARHRRPDAGRWQAYGNPGAATAEPAAGHFGDMVVFRVGGGPAIPLAGTLRICTAMRGAAMAHADQPVPEAISGHAPAGTAGAAAPSSRPHLAFVPLGDVGHAHARGHVMGVGAVLPRGLSRDERVACLRALGRVQDLLLGSLGRYSVERLGVDVAQRGLMVETWTSPARVWATVTPIVLDRFPSEPFGAEAVSIVARSCTRAGYPEPPTAVEVSRVSWVLGAPSADSFPARPAAAGRPRRYHVHARLTFERPVAGPMLLGAGRHLGYGLCRPMEAPPWAT